MGMITLYLDKLNAQMEKMLLERCSDEIDVRFLNPTTGKKGELQDADIYIVTTFQVTKDIIDAAPNLKLIQRTGIGVDMVDVEYAKEKGIPVSVCRGFNSTSVAELAVLDMLALYRRIVTMDRLTKSGEWHTWTYRHESYELVGKTVGVLGLGTIGRKVVERVKSFEAKAIYYDVQRLPEEDEKKLGVAYKPFDEIIRESDIITLHLPLLPSTKGMIGKEQFRAMKKTAVLVDTSRDLLIDLEALADALETGEISGAAVDIFDPVTESSPLFKAKDKNLIVTPHIGAATFDNYDRVYRLCASNALRILRGEQPEMVL